MNTYKRSWLRIWPWNCLAGSRISKKESSPAADLMSGDSAEPGSPAGSKGSAPCGMTLGVGDLLPCTGAKHCCAEDSKGSAPCGTTLDVGDLLPCTGAKHCCAEDPKGSAPCDVTLGSAD